MWSIVGFAGVITIDASGPVAARTVTDAVPTTEPNVACTVFGNDPGVVPEKNDPEGELIVPPPETTVHTGTVLLLTLPFASVTTAVYCTSADAFTVVSLGVTVMVVGAPASTITEAVPRMPFARA